MARISSLAVLFALLTFGCGQGEGRKPVFPVSGRVTYKGEPMAGTMIGFHPLDDPDPRAVRMQAIADLDGNYTLTTYTTGDGAPAGEYAVTLYWPGQRVKRKTDNPESEDDEIPPDRLNRSYADPKSTKLRATVQAMPNKLDFNLP